MTSLSTVYEGGVGSVVGRKRRLLGTSVFAAGVAMVVGAIPLATTGVPASFGLTTIEAREAAGILAGLGLPAVFLGIFVVLPASDTTRAAGAIGASLAVLGVALFQYAYPGRWLAGDPQFAVATMVVYATGTLITFWCLFIGVATFKTRNEPGGTARLEITDEGTVRLVETDSSLPGFGSVGLFGSDPDGDVETQTNSGDDEMMVPEPTADTPDAKSRTANDSTTDSNQHTQSTANQSSDQFAPTSDGGTTVSMGSETKQLSAAKKRARPDKYCGNCRHFEYVRADGEIASYCGLADSLMDDMDACENWKSNS